jgi:hypothetical protein
MTAEESKKAIAIQLRETAFMENSSLIRGRAIFTAELINGLKKEVIIITVRRIPLLNCCSGPVGIRLKLVMGIQ